MSNVTMNAKDSLTEAWDVAHIIQYNNDRSLRYKGIKNMINMSRSPILFINCNMLTLLSTEKGKTSKL